MLYLQSDRGTVPSAELAVEDRAVIWKEAPVAEGAAIDIARVRDQALHRLQVVAAEMRAHEQTVPQRIGSPRRPADERNEKGRGR
jgi:hypothetical protein